jgi:uncharacterized protein YkwD
MRNVIVLLFVVLITYLITLSLLLPGVVANAAEKARYKTRIAQSARKINPWIAFDSKPFSIPTNTPTPTPTGAPTPTVVPTATLSPQSPASTQATSVASDEVQAYIMNAINEYRKSQGLSSVSMDSHTCDFARKRADALVSNFSHDGFGPPYPYPSFSKVTENIAMNSNYKNVVNGWIASSGHAENMRADTPYVCVARNGNYYAYEGWRP